MGHEPSSRSRRSSSLERRLPLVMSGVLAVILATALGVTYVTLARAALATAEDRLARATRQLATVAETGLRQARARYQAVASDGAVRQALRSAAAGASLGAAEDSLARAALARLRTPTDSGMPIELWTADGRGVAYLGSDVRTGVEVAPDAPELADARRPAVPRPGIDSVAATDSLVL